MGKMMSVIENIKLRSRKVWISILSCFMLFGIVTSASACGYYHCWHRHYYYHYHHYSNYNADNLAFGLVAGSLDRSGCG